MAWEVGPLGGSLGGWAGVLSHPGLPLCSLFFLSGVFVPLRSLGTRGGRGLGTWDSGNSQACHRNLRRWAVEMSWASV